MAGLFVPKDTEICLVIQTSSEIPPEIHILALLEAWTTTLITIKSDGLAEVTDFELLLVGGSIQVILSGGLYGRHTEGGW